MERIRVVEVGSSSLLDQVYNPEDFYFIKYYHTRHPKSFNEAYNIKNFEHTILSGMINSDSTMVFSIGTLGDLSKREFSKLAREDIEHIIYVNLIEVMSLTSVVLNRLPKLNKYLYLGSIAGVNTYPTKIPYSVSKAGLIKFVDNLKVAYPDKSFSILNLGGYKTKFNGFNETYLDPKDANNLILDQIRLMNEGS